MTEPSFSTAKETSASAIGKQHKKEIDGLKELKAEIRRTSISSA
uniref:Uncharacterized protein n=1 Tax=Rhizophora mucronata TaxID=61149 RepID=A0A2P2JBT3_RHIMU